MSAGTPTLLHFGYPRTGSHYLTNCVCALYDTQLEWFRPHSQPFGFNPAIQAAAAGRLVRGDEEVKDRYNEIDPYDLYSLGLREGSGIRSEIVLEHRRTGVHGLPGSLEDGERAIILIRDPIATIFSFFRVWTERWEPEQPFNQESVLYHLRAFVEFYRAGQRLIANRPDQTMLIRFEELVTGPEKLRELCHFVGQAPKLAPEFVWHVTQFDRFVRPGHRTFYREGQNDAWKRDPAFCSLLDAVPDFDFTSFGYLDGAAYMRQIETAIPAKCSAVMITVP